MPDPLPFFSLPDEWASKARCPVCSASPLVVAHRADFPDQMACPRCHSMFEIEEKGARIYFTAVPGILIGMLNGRWLTYPEVKQSVEAVVARQSAENQAAGVPAEQPAEKAPAPLEPTPFPEEMVKADVPAPQVEEKTVEKKPKPVTVLPANKPRASKGKDLRTRAKDLYALGNRPARIKVILSRDASLDKAEIQAVLDDLYGEDEARGRRQNTRVYVSIGVGLFIILLCFVIALIGRAMFGNFAGGTSTNIIATLSANQAAAPLLATPIVVRETESGAARPTCPQTSDQASALFGGPVDNWHMDTQDGSWFLVASSPVNVHVPGGMNAILVNRGSTGVDTVPGPSSIMNVTSLSILCR